MLLSNVSLLYKLLDEICNEIIISKILRTGIENKVKKRVSNLKRNTPCGTFFPRITFMNLSCAWAYALLHENTKQYVISFTFDSIVF